MAINFLNTVNFNLNSVNNIRIQNLGTDPSAANSAIGQIYFNTTVDTLKQYVADTQNPPVPGAPTPGWVEVGVSTAVEDFTNINGTYVSNSIVNTKATGNVSTGTVDLSAVDGTSVAGTRFLSKDNEWAVVSNVAIATATTLGTVKLFSDTEQTVAAATISATALRTYGVQFNSSDQMVVNVPWTDTNVVTYTLDVPTGTTDINLKGSDGTDDPITISGSANQIAVSRASASKLEIALTPDVTIEDDLTVGGIITQTQTGGSSTTGVNDGAVSNSDALVLTADNTAIVVGMVLSGTGIVENITIATVTDAKTFVLSSATNIANTTTITFSETNSFATQLDMNNNRIAEVKTGIVGTDAVNLAQVNSLIAGNGSFKGAYNATNDPGSPIISTNNNVALSKGDYFVVTSGGVITFSDKAVTVEVGDFIFAEDDIAAGGGVGAGTASTEYIIVIADANLATAGTLTGAQRGVAGFDEDIFTVTTTSPTAGFVSLNKQTNPYGISVLLEDGVDNAAGTETTFTVDITTDARFGTGAKAKNCKAEVITEVGRLTSYPEVTGNGVGSMIFKFKPVVADGVVDTSGYRALISIV